MKESNSPISDFETLSHIAYELSMQFEGLQTKDFRKGISTHYLAKMVSSCISLLRLYPGSTMLDNNEPMDYPSIATLMRNILELSNNHWYLCTQTINDEELKFRLKLYDYHDSSSLLSIYQNIFSNDDFSKELEEDINRLKSQIENSPVYRGFNIKKRKKIIKGHKAYDLSQFQIAEKRGLNLKQFKGFYELFSIHTHSSPSSIKFVKTEKLNFDKQDISESFAELSLIYVSRFLSEFIKVIGENWGIEFAKEESFNLVYNFADELYEEE